MSIISHKRKYAIYMRIDELYRQAIYKNWYASWRSIYWKVAGEFCRKKVGCVIEIHSYVQKNKYKTEFKRERLTYKEYDRDYRQRYSSEEDIRSIEKLKNSKNLTRQNIKSEWNYYLYMRYKELMAEKKNEKKYKMGVYYALAEEFLLCNDRSVMNIIKRVDRILNDKK